VNFKKLAYSLLIVNAAIAAYSVGGSALLQWVPEHSPRWDYEQVAMVLGIANILTGTAAAFLHMGSSRGWRPTALLLGVSFVLGGAMELLSTTTGFPFGRYEYTDMLGPRFLGHVPYVIAFAWFMMLYPSLEMAFRLGASRWLAPFLAAAILTLWDIVLEAAMTTGFACWHWRQEGFFYGVPTQNWAGWLATGVAISFLWLLAVRRQMGGFQWFPLMLYGVQSVFAAALALIYGRYFAVLLWAIGFAVLMLGVTWRNQMAETVQADKQATEDSPCNG
jgi:putative membrane protein